MHVEPSYQPGRASSSMILRMDVLTKKKSRVSEWSSPWGGSLLIMYTITGRHDERLGRDKYANTTTCWGSCGEVCLASARRRLFLLPPRWVSNQRHVVVRPPARRGPTIGDRGGTEVRRPIPPLPSHQPHPPPPSPTPHLRRPGQPRNGVGGVFLQWPTSRRARVPLCIRITRFRDPKSEFCISHSSSSATDM